MKFTAIAALAFAALATAQSADDIPACAKPCLDASVTKNTKCSTTDYSCICKNFDDIQGDATSCVLKACGADVALSKSRQHSSLAFGAAANHDTNRQGPARHQGALRQPS